jgi:nucleotide-binding universal stress UspA family protein
LIHVAVTSVVVGVDNSPASDEAPTWALEEGRLRNLPVRAVNVWHPTDDPQEIERLAAPQSVAELRAGLVDEVAALSLLQAAGNADLLVVGSRGYGGWKGLLLGSVSAQCVTQSPCPVAVVRDGDGDGDGDQYLMT